MKSLMIRMGGMKPCRILLRGRLTKNTQILPIRIMKFPKVYITSLTPGKSDFLFWIQGLSEARGLRTFGQFDVDTEACPAKITLKLIDAIKWLSSRF